MLGPRDFLGEWRVTRAITDRLAARDGRFDGTARFSPGFSPGFSPEFSPELSPGGPALRYREEGTLRLGDGPPLAAARDYLWRFTPEGVEASFPDGRPFHRFRPAGRGRGTDHPCGADLYRVGYDFSAWPAWASVWEVAGPRKAYVLATRYARA